MKFPRSAKTFRGQFEAAPFMAVLFLLVMFVILSGLIYTPGVRLQLPVAADLPGTAGPGVAVAVDATGQYYFENQRIAENALRARLTEFAKTAHEQVALIVHADKAVTYDRLLHLAMLARACGLKETLLVTRPGPFNATGPIDVQR
jgi:biopolymer transport protein ExbD